VGGTFRDGGILLSSSPLTDLLPGVDCRAGPNAAVLLAVLEKKAG
jgi:hypothetical protein